MTDPNTTPVPSTQLDGTGGDGDREVARVLGVDLYTLRSRIQPAILSVSPLLAVGLAALPYLETAHKFWSLTSVAVTTFAALTARKAGNRAQERLYAEWGGAPTTVRLRYRAGSSPGEINRRHAEVERILGGGLHLPDRQQEADDPAAADLIYLDAMKRIVAKVRNRRGYELANVENRNYGFARNLLGLKRLGLVCAAFGMALSTIFGLALISMRGPSDATVALLPFLASCVAIALWRLVDPDFVRPSAEAYSDRVIEALDRLPSART